MAAAWFNQLADPEKARAISAGTAPGDRIHPRVAQAMAEVGVSLSGAVPRLLTPALAKDASLLITMGCGEACPVVPGVRRDDWPVEDPKGQSIDGVRKIRDEIAERVRALISSHGWE
jgi:arsenate reductase (thioredoxin)